MTALRHRHYYRVRLYRQNWLVRWTLTCWKVAWGLLWWSLYLCWAVLVAAVWCCSMAAQWLRSTGLPWLSTWWSRHANEGTDQPQSSRRSAAHRQHSWPSGLGRFGRRTRQAQDSTSGQHSMSAPAAEQAEAEQSTEAQAPKLAETLVI